MPNQATQQIINALLRNSSYVILMDAITLNHSSWSEPFRFIRNFVPGAQVTYEGDVYRYLPMVISRAGQDGNLNQSWTITLQDMNTQIQEAESTIPLDSDEFPTVEIRTFEYDKRTGEVTLLEGPYITNIDSINYDDKGASIKAAAERVNINGTGFKMTPDRFPTLRPFMR